MRLRFAGRESLKLVRFNAEAQGGGPAFQNADSGSICLQRKSKKKTNFEFDIYIYIFGQISYFQYQINIFLTNHIILQTSALDLMIFLRLYVFPDPD